MMTDTSSKVCDLAEALAPIASGGTLALGGMMLYRRPVAACRALASGGVRRLTIVTFSAGFETELLVRAGAVATLRTCYTGLEVFGPAPAIRSAVERGDLTLVHETELTLAAGLQAAAMDLPWLPTAHGIVGTDYESLRADVVPFDDPISGRRLLALPSIALDACILHVAYADQSGNAVFGATAALDRELALAAGHTIVCADRVVEPAALRELATDADLLSFQVSAVVETPGGAAPTSCHPHYPYDGEGLLGYLEGADA